MRGSVLVFTCIEHFCRFVFLQEMSNSTCSQCFVCDKNFSCSSALYRHRRNVHGVSLGATTYQCTLCGESASSKDNWYVHLQSVHKIEINSEKLHFNSEYEFKKWKEEIEHATRCRFVNNWGSHTGVGNSVYVYYECHRSGKYVPEGTGERTLKIQGSKKIGGKCPASMRVKACADGKHSVHFVSTHVGHEQELCHLQLTKKERDMLASSLANKIPADAVLGQIRESISDSALERIHLVTKKDLYNIEQTYNLCSSVVRHPNDAISVDAWVQDVNSGNSPTVLLYKPQDKAIELYPQLKASDFVLIIMNMAQSQLLKKYGSDCICVDGTHGLNKYGFILTTLLVLDDMREGFPCAFLISNRYDTEVMRIFFQCIKEKVGMIYPKVFMSDLAKSACNAWNMEMGQPSKKLYCTWHVERAWSTQTRKKIKDKKKQEEVFGHLRALLKETDADKFQNMLPALIDTLRTDPDTHDFGVYFQEHYVENVCSWAYCYRLHAGINTNMHLESMHRTLKYIYHHGKSVQRLDKALFTLMCFIRDKLFHRLIATEKGKLSSKVRTIRQSHKLSLTMNEKLIVKEGNVWKVPSTSKSDVIYYVQLRDDHCKCKVMCQSCDTCIHKFNCTCIDSSIKYNMCKHIHSVCTFEAKCNAQNVETVDPVCSREDPVVDERSEILAMLSREGNSNDHSLLADWKKKVISEFTNLVAEVTSNAERKVFDRQISSLKATLSAVRHQSSEFSASETEVCAMRRIVPQRRFFSTKRKVNVQSKSASDKGCEEAVPVAEEKALRMSITVAKGLCENSSEISSHISFFLIQLHRLQVV